MSYYVKNPSFEFIEDEQSVAMFDKDVKKICNVDMIGKVVLQQFNKPIELNSLKVQLEQFLTNINEEELGEFVEWLKQNDIIIAVGNNEQENGNI